MSYSQPEFKLEVYDTTHRNRGVAIVINNSHDRKGSEKDLKDVVAALKNLKFDVRILEDKTTNEIREGLEKIRKEDHTENDCLVIVAMAHGSKETIKLINREMCISDLWADFIGNECPSLIGKPKLVFIQSCRGEKYDLGTTDIKADAAPLVEEPIRVCIPMYADLLVMYSSYEEHVSFRDEQEGSWFIQSLCHVLQGNIAKIELLSLLTYVSNLVSKRAIEPIKESAVQLPNSVPSGEKEVSTVQQISSGAKQIPAINSMLRKAFYFVPKE